MTTTTFTGLPRVDQLRVSELPCHRGRDDGEITVMETGAAVPFVMARAFSTRAPNGTVRGRHAHRQCSQFMVASNGVIEVRCDDGGRTVEFRLESADRGLLVPPGIWAEVKMASEHAVLLVLCDRGYEAQDYIRDYQEFKTYRQTHGEQRKQS